MPALVHEPPAPSPSPRCLADFVGRHAGETAWLFGKGPSLDRFDLAAAGPLRVAINDVVKEIPGCVYGFANDSVVSWAHVYPPGLVLFQPLRVQHDMHAARCPVACERVWYADDWADDRLLWSRDRLARDGLAVRRGTLGSAGQILHLMGVTRIVCVGIDGGGQHAARQWNTRLRPNHAADYNAIRDAFILACHLTGLIVEFFGTDPSNPSSGMKVLKILSNTLCRGVHYCAGEIAQFAPADAAELIACHRAVIWTPPPQPAATPASRETTDAPPVLERAVLPTAPAETTGLAPKRSRARRTTRPLA